MIYNKLACIMKLVCTHQFTVTMRPHLLKNNDSMLNASIMSIAALILHYSASPFGQCVAVCYKFMAVLLRVHASASTCQCFWMWLWMWLDRLFYGNIYSCGGTIVCTFLFSLHRLVPGTLYCREKKMLAKSRQSPLCVEFQAMLRDRIKQNLASVQCTEWNDCHFMGLQTTIILMGGNIVYKVWIYYMI